MGRPSTYSLEMVTALCGRLVEGESLRAICKDDAMPGLSTVFQWLAAEPTFAELYARAREAQAETLAAEIVEIADENTGRAVLGGEGEAVAVVFDATAVARNKLRVDARKWTAAKLLPKRYGEKVDIEHSGSIAAASDEQIEKRLAELLAAQGG